MGSSTPLYRRQVSLSPQDSYQVPSRYLGALNFGPTIDSSSHISGCTMYPSPVYNYGNPGFYYDPLQFPNCVASQTHQSGPLPTASSYASCLPTLVYLCLTPIAPDNFLTDNGESLLPQFPPSNPSLHPPNNTLGLIPSSLVNPISPPCPILNMNFDDPNPTDNPSTSYLPNVLVCDAGCHLSPTNTSPVVIKEAKKLTLPQFDPVKLSWSSFAMKLHASLIECDLGYLLCKPSTNAHNAAHSKELMLELFMKLQGSAISLFTGLTAQRYNLEGGHGIEMIKALVDKFHPMYDRAIQTIISSVQTLTIADSEDLSVYRDKLENYNLQLSWVGQEMSPSHSLFI